MSRLFFATLALLLSLNAVTAAEPVGKTIELKDVDEYSHKSDALRYNNLSIKEGTSSKGYPDIDISLS